MVACAVIIGVGSASSGFNHPGAFVVASFLAAFSLLLAGVATVMGFSRVARSRRVTLVLGATYVGFGLVALLVSLVFFGLMNTCWVCL